MASGQSLSVPFTPMVADDPSEERERFGFFEVMVPVQGEVSSLQITDVAGQQIFGGIQRSTTPVTVTVTSPLPGARLDPLTKVTARVTNPSSAPGVRTIGLKEGCSDLKLKGGLLPFPRTGCVLNADRNPIMVLELRRAFNGRWPVVDESLFVSLPALQH